VVSCGRPRRDAEVAREGRAARSSHALGRDGCTWCPAPLRRPRAHVLPSWHRASKSSALWTRLQPYSVALPRTAP
jgi:hypothetical protein